MKGYMTSSNLKKDDDDKLTPWERKIMDAVADIIEFWGFKRNHGRVWAFLYIRDIPYSAADLQDLLDLSKGAVSMIIRELEWWKVVHRTRVETSSSWHFTAETNIIEMVRHVFREREKGIITSTTNKLADAQSQAQQSEKVSTTTMERIGNLNDFAHMIEQMLGFALNSEIEHLQEFFAMLLEFSKKDPSL